VKVVQPPRVAPQVVRVASHRFLKPHVIDVNTHVIDVNTHVIDVNTGARESRPAAARRAAGRPRCEPSLPDGGQGFSRRSRRAAIFLFR
jgi:hypothetical protein